MFRAVSCSRRTGESLNEVPSSGVACGPRNARRLREAIGLINKLWTEDRVTFEANSIAPKAQRSTTNQAESADLGRRLGPLAAAMAAGCRRLYLHDGKNPQLYTDLLASQEGLTQANAGCDPGADDRGQGVVRHRRTAGEGIDRHWAHCVVAEEKMGSRTDRDGTAPTHCRSIAPQPLDRRNDPTSRSRIRPYVELA